ncbi:MAG: hypothetical protein AABZ60_10415 [Planctomycetota bacterium]
MNPQSFDTSLSIEHVLLEGYRRMTPQEKLNCVVSLNDAVRQMATSRIKAQYGPSISEQELNLRLASLWLERDLMLKVFSWDPLEEGY